jgi:hypothetical protein
LDAFPADLELFFRKMIDSVSPIYHKQMARYFTIAMVAEIPRDGMMYSFSDDIEDNPLQRLSHKNQ